MTDDHGHLRDTASVRGEAEDAPARQRGGIVWKVISIGSGSVLVLAGIVALPLPGPGTLVILAGLALLSQHSRWARWVLNKVKEAAKGVKEKMARTGPKTPEE